MWTRRLDEMRVDPSDEVEVEEIVAPSFAESTGLVHLGTGRSRSVFGLDEDRVIKLSIEPNNEANLFECTTWLRNKGDPDRARWLAPVLDCADDGTWLVMQRAQRAASEQVGRLLRSPKIHDLHDLGVGDWRHVDQWGVLNGQLRLVDYGGGYGDPEDLAAIKARLLEY